MTVGGPLTWAQISERTSSEKRDGSPRESIYDWCWVCGARLGPDKMHVLIDNGRFVRHVYCCRKHRYVVVVLGSMGQHTQVQERSDLEVESLSHAFKAGELEAGWE